MNTAFEITEDDIHTVLERFQREGQYDGPTGSDDAEAVFEEHFVGDATNLGIVENGALAYDEMEDQTTSAHHEIGEILIEAEVLQGPNPYEDELPE